MKDNLMNSDEFKFLPLGNADFHQLRTAKKIYVDKTDQIYELANINNGYFFLSRPRRFGKTLLISTLESLFKDGLKDFHGLAIEKNWKDKTYPVIRINFALCKEFDCFDVFKAKMIDVVTKSFNKAGFVLPKTSNKKLGIGSSIKDLFSELSQDVTPVLLIDEYDAPLNVCLNNKKLFAKVRSELNDFYTAVKDINGQLRFMFFTGICKYKNLSIFSDTNYVTDISMVPKYGTLLGYTDDEIKRYFSPFVENAANVLKISVAECLNELKRHYDGYCFDKKALNHVHTPWSVLSFLASPEDGFENYWYASGGTSSLLLNYIAGHTLRDISEYNQDQYISFRDLDSSREINDLNDISLLYQTGYLSIKEALSAQDFILNYPNLEVANSLANLYADELFKTHNPTAIIRMTAAQLFSTEKTDEITAKLNAAFTGLNYKSYPIENEASLQNTMLIYLLGGGIDVLSELPNALGRSDLEFVAGKRYFVIELKVLDDRRCKREQTQKIEALLSQAVTQIKDKHYGESRSQDLELVRMALVFSLKQRQFVGAQII